MIEKIKNWWSENWGWILIGIATIIGSLKMLGLW